jgi:uncharacterized membrane protein YdjX (TVP38/TMEM64 family)
MKKLNNKWSWILILGGVLFLIIFLIYRYNSDLWPKILNFYDLLHNKHQLKRFIFSYGIYSPLIYISIQIIQVVFAPIPGGAIEFLGGYLFGVKIGFLYSMIGLILGSLIAFMLGRIFEKLAIEKFVSENIRKKFDYLVGHEGVILSFLLFLIPGFPKDALCYILGLTPMHVVVFLVISTIGRIPGTLMACLQGGKAFDHQYKAMIILLAISLLVILVFTIYHDQIHHMIKKLVGKKES